MCVYKCAGLYLRADEYTSLVYARIVSNLSMRESLMAVVMAEGRASSLSPKTLSMTDISVLVVSSPQKADQSLTTIPAAITSLPRFTVPVCGIRMHPSRGG